MTDLVQPPADWTEPERWVWERISAGEPADLNARDRAHDPAFKDLDPGKEEGWGEHRRLRVKFLQAVLTQKAFADATPYGGVRILGALVDDAPLSLEYARLQRLFWLENSRILTDVKWRNLRVDSDLSLEMSFVAGSVNLNGASIRESLSLDSGKFQGAVDLVRAGIGINLQMGSATFAQGVNLNSVKVDGAAFLRSATFKGDVNLVGASIGAALEMSGSTFEKSLNLSSAKVGGTAFLEARATFKGDVNFVGTSFGSVLDMTSSTFEKEVTLNSARVAGAALLRGGATFKGDVSFGGASIGATLEMSGSTFEKGVDVNSAKVDGPVFLDAGATFKGDIACVGAKLGSSLNMVGSTFEGDVDLSFTSIGSSLDLSAATVKRQVDLTGSQVTGEFRLGSSRHKPTHWEPAARLVLRNTHVGALQDWWQDSNRNCWPRHLSLEGFTFDRLGGLHGDGEAADMMARPSEAYLAWLGRDRGLSPQPYEHLAGVFRRAGEPGKAGDILYAARERRRRQALSHHRNIRGFLKGLSLWLGLGLLRSTIGYGLGNRYFRVLRWVVGLSLLGALLLSEAGTQPPAQWSFVSLFFASFDQLLPLITLNKAHDVLIFGDPSARPPIAGQPMWLQFYFYVHLVIGWVLGSFLLAGLAGLTQRN